MSCLHIALLSGGLLAAVLPSHAAPPESGLFYDLERGGNGLDLHRAGNVLFGAFYTYDPAHFPEWLWIQTVDGEAPAGTLTRYRKQGGQLVSSVAGTFTLTPDPTCATFLPPPPARQRFRMDFVLDGATYRWCMEPLLPPTQVPLVRLSGAWYDPSDPGWGLFTHHYPRFDGQVETYRTLYYHDAAGHPRWSFGQDLTSTSSTLTQRFYRTGVECVGCGASPPLTVPVGTATITLADPAAAFGSSRLSTSLAFDGAAPFVRNNVPLLLLSAPRAQ